MDDQSAVARSARISEMKRSDGPRFLAAAATAGRLGVLFADDFEAIDHGRLLERHPRRRPSPAAVPGRSLAGTGRASWRRAPEQIVVGARRVVVYRRYPPAASRMGLTCSATLSNRWHALGLRAGQEPSWRRPRRSIDWGAWVPRRRCELRHRNGHRAAVPLRRLEIESFGRHGLLVGAAAHARPAAGLCGGRRSSRDKLVGACKASVICDAVKMLGA